MRSLLANSPWLISANRLKTLWFLGLSAILSGCLESNFYVSNSSPAESAENVPRTAAIVLSFLADADIPHDLLNADNFILEDMGKTRPTAKPSPTPGASSVGDKTAPAKTPGSEGDHASDDAKSGGEKISAGSKVPAMIYTFAKREGEGKNKTQFAIMVAVSPLTMLEREHWYQLTVKAELEDGRQNKLLNDYRLTFRSGTSPQDSKNPKLLASKPLGFGPRQEPEAATPSATPPEVANSNDEANPATTPIHPGQGFILTFDQPVSPSAVRKLIQVRRRDVALGSTYQTLETKLYLIDDPLRAERRLRTYGFETYEPLAELVEMNINRQRRLLKASESTPRVELEDLVQSGNYLLDLDDLNAE